jgi:hypothetical protein
MNYRNFISVFSKVIRIKPDTKTSVETVFKGIEEMPFGKRGIPSPKIIGCAKIIYSSIK